MTVNSANDASRRSRSGTFDGPAPALRMEPKDLLEYLVVHEMLHLIAPTHSEEFLALLTKHYLSWREARAELNELPLAAESWRV